MRLFPILSTVMLLTACAKTETGLRYTSTLQSETEGVVLSEDGLDSYAGMIGSTCTIDTRWGCPTEDENLPTEDERVVDHYLGQTLATSSVGLHVLTDERYDESLDINRADIRVARMSSAGPLLLTSTPSGCELQDAVGGLGVQAPMGACTDGAVVDIDRDAGDLYVAAEGAVSVVNAQGTTDFTSGDLVAFDRVLDQVYVATKGESFVRAFDRERSLVWEVKVDGLVQDLKTRGERSQLMVLLSHGDRGSIERRDGIDGSLLSSDEIPEADGDLVVSENGQTIAVVKPDAVHFYEVEVAGEEKVVDETPANCMTMDTIQRD